MALVYKETQVDGFPYVPTSEVGDKKPFTVIIQPIDSVRLVTLEDGLFKRSEDNSMSIASGSYNVSVLCNSIVSWSNMVDEKGKDIDMILDNSGYISVESLKRLPTALINEIANVATTCSRDTKSIQTFKAD